MRLNIKELREYLIDLYERFLSGEDIRAEASKTFNDYIGAREFIPSEMTDAIGYLEDLGWEIPFELNHISNPKEHASKILEDLKKDTKMAMPAWFRKVYGNGSAK